MCAHRRPLRRRPLRPARPAAGLGDLKTEGPYAPSARGLPPFRRALVKRSTASVALMYAPSPPQRTLTLSQFRPIRIFVHMARSRRSAPLRGSIDHSSIWDFHTGSSRGQTAHERLILARRARSPWAPIVTEIEPPPNPQAGDFQVTCELDRPSGDGRPHRGEIAGTTPQQMWPLQLRRGPRSAPEEDFRLIISV